MLSPAPLIVVITAVFKRANERAPAIGDTTIRRSDAFPIGWSLGIIGTVVVIFIAGLFLLAEATAR